MKMMKSLHHKINRQRLISIIIMLCLCGCINAQVISGFVYDIATNRPIPDVCVYLDGTSINTTTDASGKFVLTTKAVINTKLVIFHLSYHIVMIDRPFDGLPDILYLKERVNILKEVTILADCFSRKQKMEAFREHFLGTTRAGESCTIQNEEDIELFFNMQTRTLSASSDKPIIVLNSYLSYQVSFTLVDFEVEYPYVTDCKGGLKNRYVRKTFFAVGSTFTDRDPNSKRIKRNREEVYKKSSNRFFKSLINNTLEKDGFKLLAQILPKFEPLPMQYFVMKDTLSQKMISINPEYEEINPVHVVRKLAFLNADLSAIFFYTDSLLVDQYGNIDRIDKVVFTGELGKNRAGDMLPIEYEQ